MGRRFTVFTIALTLWVSLAACEVGPLDPADEPNAAEASGEMVPVYFIDGHGLTAVYRSLSGRDITTELFDLVAEGPGGREELRSFLPADAELVATTESESDESLRLELGEGFWALPPGERFAAAAQITYTYASLEEGKRLFLMDGTVPGEIDDGSGNAVEQPLGTGSFGDLAPWVQVQQPVAGAAVRHSFPVAALIKPGAVAKVQVFQDGEGVSMPVRLKGTTNVNVDMKVKGEIIVRIVTRLEDGSKHTTEIPLEIVT